MNKKEIQKKVKSLSIVVLIPTYNNDKTLKKVIDNVLSFTKQIIVINDGSTDSTLSILDKYKKKIIFIIMKSIGERATHLEWVFIWP